LFIKGYLFGSQVTEYCLAGASREGLTESSQFITMGQNEFGIFVPDYAERHSVIAQAAEHGTATGYCSIDIYQLVDLVEE
jgi:hypothetical protein